MESQRTFFKENYWKLKDTDELKIYVPNENWKMISNEIHKIRKIELGERDFESPERIVLIVGATGSGKSTLINAMVNYMFGVNWEDKVRFKIIEECTETSSQASRTQAKSQTDWVTAYTIHHQPWFKIPYTLTLIDTPGFGDTDGVKRDDEITEQIRKSFSIQDVHGIGRLDAVGFVAESNDTRLTPTRKYIYDKILSLFGKDIKDNIFMLLTFSDGQKPGVLASLQEDNVSFKKHFTFNNTAVYKQSEAKNENPLDSTFWDVGRKSFGSFIQELDDVQSRSLFLTKEVLDERRRLEFTLRNIQRNVRKELHHLEQLQVEDNVLKEHKADINDNIHVQYLVNQQSKDEDSFEAIQYTQVERNTQDLKKRYEEAEGKELSAGDMIEKSGEELSRLQYKTFELIQRASKCITRLDEIALRPRVMSTIVYIDILISKEKSECEPGWKERTNQLLKLKSRCQISTHLWERQRSMIGINSLGALCQSKQYFIPHAFF